MGSNVKLLVIACLGINSGIAGCAIDTMETQTDWNAGTAYKAAKGEKPGEPDLSSALAAYSKVSELTGGELVANVEVAYPFAPAEEMLDIVASLESVESHVVLEPNQEGLLVPVWVDEPFMQWPIDTAGYQLDESPVKQFGVLQVTLLVGEREIVYHSIIGEYRTPSEEFDTLCLMDLIDPVVPDVADFLEPDGLIDEAGCGAVLASGEFAKPESYATEPLVTVDYDRDGCPTHTYAHDLPPMWSKLCWGGPIDGWIVAYTEGKARATLTCTLAPNIDKKCIATGTVGSATVNATIQNNGVCADDYGAIEDGSGDFAVLTDGSDPVGMHMAYYLQAGAFRSSTSQSRKAVGLKGSCAGDLPSPFHGTGSADAHYSKEKTVLSGEAKVVGRGLENHWLQLCN